MGFITELLNHYGYLVLFAALALELIAFPTPGETLMTYCGFLAFQGRLNWVLCIFVAATGVISGITLSYFIGRKLGTSFITKYGSYIHMGPEKMEKTSGWFKKYGNGLLILAYFIPGVRHITGYFSGITGIPFKRFAINAYIGAFLWTGVFVSLGRILGPDWKVFEVFIKKYLFIGGIIAGVTLLCIYLYRSFKQQIIEAIIKALKNSFKIFRSLGKIRIAVLVVALIFIGLSMLVAGLIQDFLANEFVQFDSITSYLVNSIFPGYWSPAMKYFSYITAYPTLIFITVLMAIWIFVKGKNRLLELRFILIAVAGAEVLEELLRAIFHRLGPHGLKIAGRAMYTFPSEQSLMAVVTYGFAAFLVIRFIRRRWIGTLAGLTALVICLASGLAPLFFKMQYPSDVTAGYVFGGVWLSLNIILLEVFRILPDIDT
ncbi:MAG TPA: VTT domain-containing protein [Ruminiclostridium sp.]|nr:VTT domain-containing protein [Ruminiclostridium sp.]